MLCVQNMAKIPARPKFIGFETRSVTAITIKNIIPLASRIASRNIQLTVLKSSRASERKMREGKAKVPTNVAIPLDSVEETTLRRPAMYLEKNICFLLYAKDSRNNTIPKDIFNKTISFTMFLINVTDKYKGQHWKTAMHVFTAILHVHAACPTTGQNTWECQHDFRVKRALRFWEEHK